MTEEMEARITSQIETRIDAMEAKIKKMYKANWKGKVLVVELKEDEEKDIVNDK